MELIIGGILALGLTLILVVPAAIIRGFVLSWLWAWFLVPLGLPELGIAHAIGVSAIVGF